MVSKHDNEEQYKFIPDYSQDFASGPAVETQLSWLFLWLFPIIPIMLIIQAAPMVIH